MHAHNPPVERGGVGGRAGEEVAVGGWGGRWGVKRGRCTVREKIDIRVTNEKKKRWGKIREEMQAEDGERRQRKSEG